MQSLLIKKIMESFQSDFFLYHDNALNKIFVSHIMEDNTLNKLYWAELIDSKNNFLKHIIDWFEIDIIFDYCFPAILIHCIRNNFINDDVMLCLIERLDPDFLSFNRCSYFRQLAQLNEKQREAVSQFLQVAKNRNDEFKTCYQVADNALELLVRRDQLINEIYEIFQREYSLDYKDIADIEDLDGLVLCRKLSNIYWMSLIQDGGEILTSIIDEYFLLSDKAFHYFMPACMIISLLKYFQDNSDISFYTLNNLCLITDKNIHNSFMVNRFLFFTHEEKKLIADFLNLILEFGISPNESKMIQASLTDFWFEDRT